MAENPDDEECNDETIHTIKKIEELSGCFAESSVMKTNKPEACEPAKKVYKGRCVCALNVISC